MFRPEVRRGHSADLFLLLWLLLSLGVFSVARSRLPLYVLPLFVPLALLVARRLGPAFRLSTPWAALLAAWAVLLMGSQVATAVWFDEPRDGRSFAQAIRSQVAFEPRTVYFVEREPYFGLSLYFDAEIQELELGRPSPSGSRGQNEVALLAKIRDVTPAALLVVRERDTDEFLSQVNRAGRKATPLGGYRDLRFYVLP
jgi:hypothetical protein